MRSAFAGLLVALVAVSLVGLPTLAYAWGPTGHRVVARIAENHMSPAARAAAVELVGPAGLAPISTWADEIKSDPRYTGGVAGRPDTRRWHYINLGGIGEFPESSGKSSVHDIRHLVDAIRHFESVLGDASRPKAERAEALKWLVHLYGDLHQPLHVGMAADKGGNTVDVEWFGERSNLHRVWDSGIIDRSRLSFTEIVQFIDHAPPDAIARAQAGDLKVWTAEGIALRGGLYEMPLGGHKTSGPPRPRLGYAYLDRHRATVHDRLLTAGLRLAARLEAMLAP